MSNSLISLKETAPSMHRVVFEISNVDTWYAIMREARTMFGRNWRCQSHVKRKLMRNWANCSERVWFEVPDAQFGTWCSLKLAVAQVPVANK